jgi:hypothetical protein
VSAQDFDEARVGSGALEQALRVLLVGEQVMSPSSKNGFSGGSEPDFSYALVSSFVTILLASTSG